MGTQEATIRGTCYLPFANEKTGLDMTLRSGCKPLMELRFQPMEAKLQGTFSFNNKSYKPPLFPFLLSCQTFGPGFRPLAQPWPWNHPLIIYFSAFGPSLSLKFLQFYLSQVCNPAPSTLLELTLWLKQCNIVILSVSIFNNLTMLSLVC